MHPMVEEVQKAIEEPEVQEMLQRLARYGLGIFMPPHLSPGRGHRSNSIPSYRTVLARSITYNL